MITYNFNNHRNKTKKKIFITILLITKYIFCRNKNEFINTVFKKILFKNDCFKNLKLQIPY